MAWGDTPEQTLDELRAVAKALIQSRQERGVPIDLDEVLALAGTSYYR